MRVVIAEMADEARDIMDEVVVLAVPAVSFVSVVSADGLAETGVIGLVFSAYLATEGGA